MIAWLQRLLCRINGHDWRIKMMRGPTNWWRQRCKRCGATIDYNLDLQNPYGDS
jgi:hypothetical protein